jgi:hypothetical protein
MRNRAPGLAEAAASSAACQAAGAIALSPRNTKITSRGASSEKREVPTLAW